MSVSLIAIVIVDVDLCKSSVILRYETIDMLQSIKSRVHADLILCQCLLHGPELFLFGCTLCGGMRLKLDRNMRLDLKNLTQMLSDLFKLGSIF